MTIFQWWLGAATTGLKLVESDQKFVSAVEAIYNAALDPLCLPGALQSVAESLGDIGATLLWRRDCGLFGCITSSTVLESQRDYEPGGWLQFDLRALRATQKGCFFGGGPFTDRHVCSEEEIRTDPVYAQLQARHGVRWFGAEGVSPDPKVGVVLRVHRSSKRPPFSDAELEYLVRLGRHMTNALRLSMRVFDAEVLQAGLSQALSRVQIGVFCIDSLGRVLSVNSVGESLLGDGLAVVGGRLVLGTALQRVELVDGLRLLLLPSTPGADVIYPRPILILRHETRHPLVLYVLPFEPPSNPAAQFLAHACAVVLAIDPEASGAADPELVRELFGLALGESRPAALVGSGLTPRCAAEKLGVTESTARSVLKNVFYKAGVSRQSELALLFGRVSLH